MKVHYLGPRCTFSELAAVRLANRLGVPAEMVPLSSMEAVAHSLSGPPQECDDHLFAVLPYYNYLEGLVQETLDLIYEHRMVIVGAQRVRIEWALGTPECGAHADRIYSHPKGLAQCSQYLWEHYPDAEMMSVASTAEGARIVCEAKAGLAVAGRQALVDCGLEIVAENIGNRRHGHSNFTDFYLLAKTEAAAIDPPEDNLTMIVVTPYADRPGLLAEILSQVAYHNLNNAKIHSRPAIDDVITDIEPQMFYLEIACHRNNPDFLRCIESIRYRLTPKEKEAEVLRVLGSYRRPRCA